jgi:hypothetical protein
VNDHFIEPPKASVQFKGDKLIYFNPDKITVVRYWGESAGCWVKTPEHGFRATWYPQYISLESHFSFVNVQFMEYKPLIQKGAWHDGSVNDFLNRSWFAIDESLDPKIVRVTRQYLGVLQHHANLWKAIQTIPEEVRHTFQSQWVISWDMLQFFNRVPEGIKLYHSNPALAWILAHWTIFKPVKRKWRSVRSLIKKKQSEIVGRAGFPATKSTIKVFRKIRLHSFSPGLFFLLRKSLSRSGIRERVLHLKSIDLESLLALYPVPKLPDIPEPPFSGTVLIQPIDSLDALKNESEEMGHCILDYEKPIRMGGFYAYHTENPERATIGIHKKNNRTWVVSQVRGKKNVTTGPLLKEVIQNWVKQRNGLILSPNAFTPGE